MKVLAYGGPHHGKQIDVDDRIHTLSIEVLYETPQILGLSEEPPERGSFTAAYPVIWDRVLGHPDTGVVYSPIYWYDSDVDFSSDL